MVSNLTFKTDAGEIRAESFPSHVTVQIDSDFQTIKHNENEMKKKKIFEKVMLEAHRIHEESKHFIICRFEVDKNLEDLFYRFRRAVKRVGMMHVVEVKAFDDGEGFMIYSDIYGEDVMPYDDFWVKLKKGQYYYGIDKTPLHFYHRNRAFQSHIGIWVCNLIKAALEYILFEEPHPRRWKIKREKKERDYMLITIFATLTFLCLLTIISWVICLG